VTREQILDFNQAKKQGDIALRFTVDADDIKARLHAEPARFCRMALFGPGADHQEHRAHRRREGQRPARRCPSTLPAPDAGLWKDHATDEGGDLIGLYRASMPAITGIRTTSSLSAEGNRQGVPGRPHRG
jgi:hypothetical protein